MNDSYILKIALICSIIGLIALYFVSNSINPELLNPTTNFEEKEFVYLNGTIHKISDGNGAYYIKVIYSSEADVVAFSKENLEFKEGDKIEIIGKTDSFNGKRQIIADKIKVIKND